MRLNSINRSINLRIPRLILSVLLLLCTFISVGGCSRKENLQVTYSPEAVAEFEEFHLEVQIPNEALQLYISASDELEYLGRTPPSMNANCKLYFRAVKSTNAANIVLRFGDFEPLHISFPVSSVDRQGMPGIFEMNIDAADGYPLPAAFSMPFPKGELWDISRIRIFQDDTEIPSQYRVLNRWSDGSLRWVQGISSVSGDFKVTYNYAEPEIEVREPVKVINDESWVRMQSGDIHLQVDLQNGDADFSNGDDSLSFHLSELVDSNGKIFNARQIELDVIEEGPIRGSIRLKGYHVNAAGEEFMRFDIFISLYTGVPILEITHVLGVNQRALSPGRNREFLSWKSLSIPVTLNHDLVSTAYMFSTDGKRYSIPEKGHLFQGEDYSFEILDAENNIWKEGERADGVILADGIFMVMPEFWQQWPKGVSVEENHINIGLFPRLDLPESNRYSGRSTEHIWYCYFRDDLYTMRQGVEKAHKFYLGFTGKNHNSFEEETILALRESAIGLPDPEYIVKTKAIGEFVPAGGFFKDWDDEFQRNFSIYIDQQEQLGWYGVFNWGDWHGERTYNWGNLEYDDPSAFFKQALRFQDATYFRKAVQGAQHYIDIDTISEHWDTRLIGEVWSHTIGHTGGYYPPGSFPSQSDRLLAGTSSPGHTRAEGVSLMYLLTGDIRALEHVRKIAEHLMMDPQWRPKGYYTAREPGWAMIALTAAYDATGSRSYLEGAEIIANAVLASAEGKGVWYRPLESTMCLYTEIPGHPRCHGEHEFMTAVQAIGMIRTYERTGREDILENIITTGYYLIENLYDPEVVGFVHSLCPLRKQSRKLGGVNSFLWYPLAYAYLETGDSRLREVLVDTLTKASKEKKWFDTDPFGKGLPAGSLFMAEVQGLIAPVIDILEDRNIEGGTSRQ